MQFLVRSTIEHRGSRGKRADSDIASHSASGTKIIRFGDTFQPRSDSLSDERAREEGEKWKRQVAEASLAVCRGAGFGRLAIDAERDEAWRGNTR